MLTKKPLPVSSMPNPQYGFHCMVNGNILHTKPLSGLIRGHLYRLMREEYNTTPLAYVTQLRMNYASNLLLYSGQDVLSVAMEAGYFSVSHFIAQFKKYFGMPPKQYRIKNRPDF